MRDIIDCLTQQAAAQYLLLYEMSLPYGLDLNNQINGQIVIKANPYDQNTFYERNHPA